MTKPNETPGEDSMVAHGQAMSSVDNQRLSDERIEELLRDDLLDRNLSPRAKSDLAAALIELQALRDSATEAEPVAWAYEWRFENSSDETWNSVCRIGAEMPVNPDCVFRNARPLFASPLPPEQEGVATHRHVKRGTDYVLIGFGRMQAEGWYDPSKTISTANVDMREVAIYRSIDDSSLWVRPREEFEDGRFAALSHTDGENGK